MSPGYHGAFGPHIQALALSLAYDVQISQPALLHCERLARHVGLPLIVTKRKQGDLLDRVSPALAGQRPQVRESRNLPAHPALVVAGDAVLPL